MATLKNEHKRLIVERLATFVSRADIQIELQELGVAVEYSQICYYDPTIAGNDLAQNWKDLFTVVRAVFLKDTASIAIAQKSFRLREIEKLYRQATSGRVKNIALAMQLLEQAAKEMGEAYTNKRVVEVGDPATALASMLGISVDDVNTAVTGASAQETAH